MSPPESYGLTVTGPMEFGYPKDGTTTDLKRTCPACRGKAGLRKARTKG